MVSQFAFQRFFGKYREERFGIVHNNKDLFSSLGKGYGLHYGVFTIIKVWDERLGSLYGRAEGLIAISIELE
jgi:hypothetical protein